MNIVRMLLKIFGGLLILNSVVLFFITNLNFGVFITFAVGLALLLYGIYFNKINGYTKKGMFKWIRYFIYVCFGIFVSFLLFLAVYGQADTTTYQEDVLIVLGAGIRGETVTLPLAYRLDKAVEYSLKNPNALIVVTGGQGIQENITEALAMERYLLQKGIPKEKIIKEEQATSTYENFLYSKDMLDKHFEKPYQSVFITNDFHIYRASRLAKIAGMQSNHLHARLEWYTIPVNYFREFFAVIKLWILQK